MGIQINGQTDTVTAIDGSITVGTDLTVPGVLTYDDVTNIDSVGIITARSGIHVSGIATFGSSIGIGTNNPTGTNALTDNTSTLAVGIATVGALNVNGNAYPSAGALSNRNLITNGDFRINQRGLSVYNPTGGTFTLDRWQLYNPSARSITR